LAEKNLSTVDDEDEGACTVADVLEGITGAKLNGVVENEDEDQDEGAANTEGEGEAAANTEACGRVGRNNEAAAEVLPTKPAENGLG